MKPAGPKLSVVATTRNDDHGGNQLARTQLFIEGLAEQSNRFELPVELVLVEWNPPPGRPPLAEALRWPRSDWFEPNIVVVPPEVHGKLPHAKGLPLFQMIAKNVGIRRAQAPLVLATNIDILFSDDLVKAFHDLKADTMYRVDRRDIVADLDKNPLPTPAECRALPWVRAHTRDGQQYPDGRRPPWLARTRSRFNRTVWNALHGGALPPLHTEACGDFTLTTREVWFAMRGYPEWPMYSFLIDGIALFQAYRAGVEMVTLPPPMVIYHLEHGEGSGWTPEGARRLFGRLDAAGVPYLSGSDYDRIARELLKKGPGYHTYNDAEWGMAATDLKVVRP